MEFKDAVAYVAMVLTILQFLSGSLICKKIIHQGNTGSVSGLTFVCGIFSTGLWLAYSLLLQDVTMSVTNIFGLLTQVLYLVVYMVYCVAADSKNTLRQQLVGLFVVVASIGYYVLLSDVTFETVKFNIGLLCCLGTILFCASPLASLAEVVKTKSTASLPFCFILLVFLVTLLWGTYGYLIDDLFVLLPNAICCVIAAIQLSLFWIYPNTEDKGN